MEIPIIVRLAIILLLLPLWIIAIKLLLFEGFALRSSKQIQSKNSPENPKKYIVIFTKEENPDEWIIGNCNLDNIGLSKAIDLRNNLLICDSVIEAEVVKGVIVNWK